MNHSQPQSFVGPNGWKLTFNWRQVEIESAYGLRFGMPLEDFEAFVEFCNEQHAPDASALLDALKYVCAEIHNRSTQKELERMVGLVERVIEEAEGKA